MRIWNLCLILIKPRTDPSTQDPIVLGKIIEIPRKPKAPEPAAPEHANGTTDPEAVTGKRKREAEDITLVNGQPRTKRVATDGDGSHPIVLDEDEGAILLE